MLDCDWSSDVCSSDLDLISIAEVVRDLHRADSQPEQSYSERQLYESALDRMAREVAAANKIDKDAAVELLGKSLSAKKPAPAAAEAEAA
jgi:CarD family transcriptional regulator